MRFPTLARFSPLLFSFLLLPCACTHSSEKREGPFEYPPAWWQAFPPESKASWEILPTEARPGEVILSKRTELGIFSNFTEAPFTYRGVRYRSVEGFWQMMLYPEDASDERALAARDVGIVWPHTRAEVARMVAFDAKSAGEAAEKILGRLGIDWVSFQGEHFPYRSAEKGEHYRLIRAAMCEKLRQNPKVRSLLLETGDLVLRPDHHPEADAPAEWAFYDLWMMFRAEIQTGKDPICETPG